MFLEASICECFDGQIIVGGWPYPKLWGKYKKPYPKFHRFCHKSLLKFDFFHKCITSICYVYILVSDYIISLWFWTSTNLENFLKFSYFSNFQFLGSTNSLHFMFYKLAELWPRTKIFPPKYPSMIPLKVSHRHNYENYEDIRDGWGQNYVNQKTLVFPSMPPVFTNENTI